MENNRCINCKEDSGLNWFCPTCYKIKEEAYKKARDLGITNYNEVIIMRDKALTKYKNNQNQNEKENNN